MRSAKQMIVPLCSAVVASSITYYSTRPAPRPSPASQPALIVATESPVTLMVLEVDGLSVWPGVPVIDSRPICDGAGMPLTLNYRLLWSNGYWVTGKMNLPLYSHMSFDLGQFGGLFDLTLAPPDVYADVTGDGRVTTIDLAKVQRLSGVVAENPDRTICDLDRSGVVDEADEQLCRGVIGGGI